MAFFVTDVGATRRRPCEMEFIPCSEDSQCRQLCTTGDRARCVDYGYGVKRCTAVLGFENDSYLSPLVVAHAPRRATGHDRREGGGGGAPAEEGALSAPSYLPTLLLLEMKELKGKKRRPGRPPPPQRLGEMEHTPATLVCLSLVVARDPETLHPTCH